ncbi:hypothetical protein BGX34_008101 [Mortierella sp. NVP85]|nr:hypothetical protein BGX34_008101 [Mortierella sp. NVP85]
MAARNPLDIPEILALVGKYIPLWRCIDSQGRKYAFQPQDMVSCTQVSQLFRIVFLPILWYTFDEKAMRSVPHNVIQKYAPYFKAHFYYGFRSDCSTDYRPLNTQLVHLSMSTKRARNHHVQVIKSNPGLKSLGVTCIPEFSLHYSDAFENLKQLKEFRYRILAPHYLGKHQELMLPISPTLEKLHISVVRQRLGLDGLTFPKLKELKVGLSHSQDGIDLLQGSPNLETLVSTSNSFILVKALETGACPALKNLKLDISNGTKITLAAILESRIGLQTLELRVESFDERLATAINCHAPSLTRLSIRRLTSKALWGPSTSSFLLRILGTCGGLQDVKIGTAEDAVGLLLTMDHWKNPDVLENLLMGIAGENMRVDVNRETDEYLDGWKLPPGKTLGGHTETFLKMVFEAAEGFCRLRTIILDGIVYKKANTLEQ